MLADKPDYDVIGGNEPRMLRSQNEAYGEDMKNYWKFIPLDRSKTKFITAKITGNPEDLLDENGMLDGRAGTLVLYDEEDYMEFLDFLDNASSPVTERIPAELHDIIFEEIDAYKKGSRTAEKTAEIIQSRVSIYLSERE